MCDARVGLKISWSIGGCRSRFFMTIFIRHSNTKDIRHSWKVWTYIHTVLDHYYLKHSIPGIIIFLVYIYIGQAIELYEYILVPIFFFMGFLTYISIAVENYPKAQPQIRAAPVQRAAPRQTTVKRARRR